MNEKEYAAVVDKIVPDGKHGPYAVAKNDTIGYLTFSLIPRVWQEKELPELGTIVVLGNIQKKRSGWRALQGRFYRPADQHGEKTI
jgi:hypothetical protein